MRFFKRAGASIAKFIRTADPSAEPNKAFLYAKESGGVTKLFMRDSAGTVTEVGSGGGGAGGGTGGPYALPEQWAALALPASAVDEPMGSQLDMADDSIIMLRSGNVTGLLVKLSEPLAAGTITVRVTINGVAGDLFATTSGSNTVAWATQEPISDSYVAGDQIGLIYSTDSSLSPADTIDVKAWVQVTEAGAAVPLTRSINTAYPLSGGGDLSTDLTLSVDTFTSSSAGVVPASGGGTANFLRADGVWQEPPGVVDTFTSSSSGIVPASGGGTTNFLRADGTWQAPAIGSSIVTSTILANPASIMTVEGLDGDTDEVYVISFSYIANTTAAHNIDIRPNGTTNTSNRRTTRIYEHTSFTYSTDGVCIANGGVSYPVCLRGIIYCWASRNGDNFRRFLLDATETFNAGQYLVRWEARMAYLSNDANLTSLSVGISGTDFAAGSSLVVRRVI